MKQRSSTTSPTQSYYRTSIAMPLETFDYIQESRFPASFIHSRYKTARIFQENLALASWSKSLKPRPIKASTTLRCSLPHNTNTQQLPLQECTKKETLNGALRLTIKVHHHCDTYWWVHACTLFQKLLEASMCSIPFQTATLLLKLPSTLCVPHRME